MDEVHIYSPRSTAQVPPPYIYPEPELKDVLHKSYYLLEEFSDELPHIISPPDYNHFYFDLVEELN